MQKNSVSRASSNPSGPPPQPKIPPHNPATKKDNTWGWMILGAFILFICIIIFSVYLVLSRYPVEMDNQYDMNYHSVDEQYNDLMEMSREFDRRYDFVWSGKKQLGPNQWRFSLRDKQGNSISSAEVRLLVTREATTKQDIDLGALPYVDSYYIAELDVPAAGTWLLNMNLLVKDLRVNRQFIMDLPATTAQKTDAEKLINARKRIEALESKN